MNGFKQDPTRMLPTGERLKFGASVLLATAAGALGLKAAEQAGLDPIAEAQAAPAAYTEYDLEQACVDSMDDFTGIGYDNVVNSNGKHKFKMDVSRMVAEDEYGEKIPGVDCTIYGNMGAEVHAESERQPIKEPSKLSRASNSKKFPNIEMREIVKGKTTMLDSWNPFYKVPGIPNSTTARDVASVMTYRFVSFENPELSRRVRLVYACTNKSLPPK